MKYEVRFMQDDTYEVYEMTPNDNYDEDEWNPDEPEFHEEKVYQGSLSDCDAFIRLKTNGHM